MKSSLKLIASYQVTIIFLALAILLFYFAAIEQDSLGLPGVKDKYFQAAFVYWEIPDTEIFLPYMFGGYVLGIGFCLNLVAGLIVAAQWKLQFFPGAFVRLGFFLMILSWLVSSAVSKEGVLTVAESRETDTFENPDGVELVLFDRSQSLETDRVYVISQDRLEKRYGARIADLPFTLSVSRFLPNARLAARKDLAPRNALLANKGLGTETYVTPLPKSTQPNEANRPATLVTLFNHDTDEVLGTWLLVMGWLPQTFSYQNSSYALQLRNERSHLPFSVKTLIANGNDQDSALLSISEFTAEDGKQFTVDKINPLKWQSYSFHYKEAIDGSQILVVLNPTRSLYFVALILILVGFAGRLAEYAWQVVEDKKKTA